MYFCLIDGSYFYVSASLAMMPQFRDKPTIVTGGQDGLVSIAANRICTNSGIPKFSPVWENEKNIKNAGGAIIKANFNMLGNLSNRMMASIINSIGADIPHTQYSVDEIFFDLNKLYKMGVDINEYLQNVRKKVYQETRIGTGCGIGRTLCLSKVAMYAAKRVEGFHGQCFLNNIKLENQILKVMPVTSLWGIGNRLGTRLKALGIENAFQLKMTDPQLINKEFNINLSNIVYELNGKPIYDLNFKTNFKKQIFSTASYHKRLTTSESIFSKLAIHADLVGKKLRKQQSEAKIINIFLQTSKYDKVVPYSKNIEINLNEPTSDTSRILSAIRTIEKKLIPANLDRQPIYKVGVGASKIIHNEMYQLDFFHKKNDNINLMKTIDKINLDFGNHTILFASSIDKNEAKKNLLRSKNLIKLSNYLTDKKEFVKIKCI